MFIRYESFSQYIRYYPVVSILIACNLLIFLLEFIPSLGQTIQLYGIGYNELVGQGQWWRLITPMFLHAGFLHLLSNMFSLFLFGPELEKFTGKMRFFTLYLLSGIFGNIATYLFEDSHYIHLGASGAIFGIFGAYASLLFYTKKALPQLRQVIVPILVFGIIMTFIQSNVNIAAHIGGLVAGIVIGLIFFHPSQIKKWLKTS